MNLARVADFTTKAEHIVVERPGAPVGLDSLSDLFEALSAGRPKPGPLHKVADAYVPRVRKVILQAIAATRNDVSLSALASEIHGGNQHAVEAHLSIVMNKLEASLRESLEQELRLNVIAAARAVAKGGIRRLVTAEWDESEHPRDEKGQFSNDGGSDSAGAYTDFDSTEDAGQAWDRLDAKSVDWDKEKYQMKDGTYASEEYFENGIAANKALREGKVLSKDQREMTAALDNVIKDTKPLKENITVYRGLTAKTLPKVGQVFEDLGFVSTSLDKKVAKSFIKGGGKNKILARILLPKGSRGSAIGFNEQEFLLGRNSGFKVVGIAKGKITTVTLRYLGTRK